MDFLKKGPIIFLFMILHFPEDLGWMYEFEVIEGDFCADLSIYEIKMTETSFYQREANFIHLTLIYKIERKMI